MKKIIATILSLFFLGIIKAQPLVSETQSTIQYPDKELELPEHIKFADLNKDNFLSLNEAKAIFDQYRDNQQKHLKNDLVDEVESAVIEFISYLEGIDCRDIKKSVASKRFIEVYYNNKFLNLHEP